MNANRSRRSSGSGFSANSTVPERRARASSTLTLRAALPASHKPAVGRVLRAPAAAATVLPRTASFVRARLGAAISMAVVILLSSLFVERALANGFASASFLQPSDLVPFQGFGWAVVADGNLLAAGCQFAPYAVYVYTNDNGSWVQQARLTSPSGSLTDRFGSSLAIQGNTLVVGAGGASAAYVFNNVNGAWVEQAVVVPSGGSGAGFGGSPLDGMSLSGNTLVVGAPAEPTAAGNTGSVYVFVNLNGVWAQQQRITPTDPLVSGFGTSVAVQNDNLLIGAPFSGSPTVFQPGAAFVFTRQSGVWNQQARLDPVDVVEAGLYGLCVSLDGNTAVIGAERPSEAEIFVNHNGVWSFQAIVQGPEDSDFGTSVKVIGDLLMVTAYDDVSPTGFQSGDAFVFTRGGSTWTEQPDLFLAPGANGIPGPGQDKQRFGNFATMTKAGSRTIFVMGSHTYSNPDASRVGAVYTATLN